MNTETKRLVVLVLIMLLFAAAPAPGQAGPAGDRTSSPYFFVASGDSPVDALPLKATSAKVLIAGVIAHVQVTQVYKNEGAIPLEAVYVFPASTRAAVHAMKMTVGDRVIEAEIRKRDEARQAYERARDEGRSASLLEEERPNVFRMNVANILPGDEIRVELGYTELLVPTERVYEFVYPTVVGPRYANGQNGRDPSSEDWNRNPYLHEGNPPNYTFDMAVTVSTGLPVGEVSCPSHRVTTVFDGPAAVRIALDASERQGGNRDFILRYRLDGDRVRSGLLLYEGRDENFFLLMTQPPASVVPEDMPPREYVFIVDVSGSMHGFPLEVSKTLLRDLLGGLRPVDRFNVLLFAGGSTLLSGESLPATADNLRRALDVIDRQRGGGGTELLPALQRALSLPGGPGLSRTFVIATDGYVTVEEEVFDLVRTRLGDANFFAFGIGSSVNRHIIEGMARMGMGEPFIVTKAGDAPSEASRFRRTVAAPVLTDVAVSCEGFDVFDVEPLNPPDVLAERPVIVFGKWRGTPRGTITVTGMTGKGPYREKINIGTVRPTEGNRALRYLWARHRIALLSDYNSLRADDGRIGDVTRLGLEYHLLTAWTSFVAVDTRVRNSDGRPEQVVQPLPLPRGVSDYAIGGSHLKAAGPALSMPLRNTFSEAADRPAQDRGKGEEIGKSQAKLAVSQIKTSPELSREAVEKVFQSRLPDLEACLAGLETLPSLTFDVILRPDGTVKDVREAAGLRQAGGLLKCLVEKIKSWTFPRSGTGREERVTVTITPVP